MLKTQSAYLSYLENVEKLICETPLSTDELVSAKEDVSRTELLVPVIGAFSAGKSSLINAFLGEDVLGVGLTPETELATELRYGIDPHLLALRPDGSRERLELTELARLKSRASEFTHLQMYLNNPQLKAFSSLVLVDMPGFGSSLTNHNKAIAYYLPRGAHFIVVTSVEDGNITQSIMRQLDDLQTYEREFTFILNKVNLRSDEQVEDVANLIEEQIKFGFSSVHPLVRVGLNGHERLAEILTWLEPEQVFQHLFQDQLKGLTHSLINQINLALTSLKKDQKENEYALHELTNGINKIKSRRDGILAKLRDQQVTDIVERCLSEAGLELERAREELVSMGLSRNQEGFARTVSEVVRSSLTRTVRDQMDTVSRSVVADFSLALGDLGKTMASFNGDQEWLGQLSDKINHSLQKTGETLGHWSGSLAERNARELENLKQETNWQTGQPLPRAPYQGLATVLAVATSVVNPLVELAIIFLPNILAFFNENRQKEQLRQKVMNEVIPSVKREMRDKLSTLLRDQMDLLVTQVSAEFEREIGDKQQIIDELMINHRQGGQDPEAQINVLTGIRERLQQLATETLYCEAK